MLFYDIIILAPITTIFIYLIDSSLLNLMVLKWPSTKYGTFLVLAWKSSIDYLPCLAISLQLCVVMQLIWYIFAENHSPSA